MPELRQGGRQHRNILFCLRNKAPLRAGLKEGKRKCRKYGCAKKLHEKNGSRYAGDADPERNAEVVPVFSVYERNG